MANAVQRPANTQVMLREYDRGFHLSVPPVGFLRGGYGLSCFGLLWLSFIAACTVVALVKGPAESSDSFGTALVLAVFWGIGIGLTLWGANMGLGRGTIEALDDCLQVHQVSPFGERTDRWSRAEIAAIDAAPAGLRMGTRRSGRGGTPVMHLQVSLEDGTKVGRFAGRDPEELKWIAGLLREWAQLPYP